MIRRTALARFREARRMFRFSLRDLFWLTLVVALAVGWAVDRWRAKDPWDEKYETEVLVEALRTENEILKRQLPPLGE